MGNSVRVFSNPGASYASSVYGTPVIGTFKPRIGDFARDNTDPIAQMRMWTGAGWHPSFNLIPKGAGVSERREIQKRIDAFSRGK
jgi:hypothetical protein